MFPIPVVQALNSVGKYWARVCNYLTSYGMYDHLSHLTYIPISL